MSDFQVSVVMPVYNGEHVIERTLESLDQQQGITPEIVVVNDGSTDNTRKILDRYGAGKPNYRIIHQSNQGLTSALIQGCEAASGRYIARQDAGDISLPDRLAKQFAALSADPALAMVSCATQFTDQEGYATYKVTQNAEVADSGLLGETVDAIVGPPHHGSVMFRNGLYQQVGGYRPEFFVAQDIDLWMRLREVGNHICLDEVLYQADSSPSGISFSHRHIQQQVTSLMLKARQLRRAEMSERSVLDQVQVVSRATPRTTRGSQSAYHFFIAGCQRNTRPDLARRNYLRAIKANPLHFKAIIRYFQTRC